MPDPEDLSWRQLVREAEAALTSAQVPDPDISARMIGQRATGAEPGEWAQMLATKPHKRQLAQFDAMVGRRSKGEPLQYVLAQWGFRHLDLFIDSRVLIPRPETEIVAGAAIDEVARVAGPDTTGDSVVVVDLGTGSGAIGLSVAYECAGTSVWLTDVSTEALAVARANLAGLGTRGSGVQLAAGSWFEALPPELKGNIHVVVSNPPYVGVDDDIDPQIKWEPAQALFAQPADSHLTHLAESAADWLADDGALVLEMAPDQTEHLHARATGLYREAEVRNDLSGRRRAVVARRPRRQ